MFGHRKGIRGALAERGCEDLVAKLDNTMIADNIGSYVPQVRPHIRRREGKLFFMISARPLLDICPEAIPLYISIDGRRTVEELEKMHPGACDQLLRWYHAEIIELLPPISSPTHPHLVVIEPHMDDAALSVGGRLLHRRGRCRITILSVVKWSNFTSYLLLKRSIVNVNDVTDLRLRESALVARFLGAEHCCLDWSDAPIRFWPAQSWSLTTVEKFKADPHTFVKLFPSSKQVALLAQQLAEALGSLAPDELWIPMGLGDHIDHRTTRSACLLALADARDRLSSVPVSMYEDLPYASNSGHAAQITDALTKSGASLIRLTEDVTDVFEEKLRAVSIYGSQFKLSYMGPVLRKLGKAEADAAGSFGEAYHRLEGHRSLPREVLLSREVRGLEKLHNDARALMLKRSRNRRLTVMALPSGQLGQWNILKESLLTALPDTDFLVYVSEDAAWQAPAERSDKLKVEIIREGRMRWLGVLFHELLRFRTPTVVLWRGAYASEPVRIPKLLINMLIRSLLPFRRVLFARTLWDFCCVLKEESGGAGVARIELEGISGNQDGE